MKVKIGNIEISDLSLDELDKIVARYGGCGESAPTDGRQQSDQTGKKDLAGGSHADTVLLKRMIDAGTTGLSTNEIGDILQRRGKALPTAVEAWSRRISLKEGTLDPYEYCRVGTKRHIRIKQTVYEVAKRIAAQHK